VLAAQLQGEGEGEGAAEEGAAAGSGRANATGHSGQQALLQQPGALPPPVGAAHDPDPGVADHDADTGTLWLQNRMLPHGHLVDPPAAFAASAEADELARGAERAAGAPPSGGARRPPSIDVSKLRLLKKNTPEK
jgi:hypothetical protein